MALARSTARRYAEAAFEIAERDDSMAAWAAAVDVAEERLADAPAVEVGVFYLESLQPVLVPILLALSAAKFTMVVGFFMHLKFDSRLYRALFVGPLIVAIAVMLAMFLLYGVFNA